VEGQTADLPDKSNQINHAKVSDETGAAFCLYKMLFTFTIF